MRLFAAAVICLLIFDAPEACAQSITPKFEIGVHFTALRLKEIEKILAHTYPGVGGRFTYNITDNVAVEAEGNYLPEPEFVSGLRVTQGLFGVKAGARGRRVGVFGKAGPGFRLFKSGLTCVIPEGCPTAPPAESGTKTEFVFDIGGVIEFYPSRRVSLRTDFGDTIVRFDQGLMMGRRVHYTSHNLQFSTGVSFRF